MYALQFVHRDKGPMIAFFADEEEAHKEGTKTNSFYSVKKLSINHAPAKEMSVYSGEVGRLSLPASPPDTTGQPR